LQAEAAELKDHLLYRVLLMDRYLQAEQMVPLEPMELLVQDLEDQLVMVEVQLHPKMQAAAEQDFLQMEHEIIIGITTVVLHL
jgi:hypothetical protein